MDSARLKRLHTQIFMCAFHVIALVAIISFYWYGSWSVAIVGFCIWALKNCPGVGVTFHRLLVHRSFQTYKYIEYFLVCIACLALQGWPAFWVAVHRKHHKYTDLPGDPHSPLEKDSPLAGFSWAQWGWMLSENEATQGDLVQVYAKDLIEIPFYQKLEKLWWIPSVILALLLVCIGWYIEDFFYGIQLFIYGYFVPIVVGWEITWLVNSVNHTKEIGGVKVGYRNFETSDQSNNCWWVAVLTFGEGNHNNHHKYPWSARHGLTFWERLIDLNYWFILGLSKLRLARKINLADNI